MEEEEQDGLVDLGRPRGAGLHGESNLGRSPLDGQETVSISDQEDPALPDTGENPVDPASAPDYIEVGGGQDNVVDGAAANRDEEEDEGAELKVTLRKTDNTQAELPENVQKLLEDSIKKEYNKKRMDGGQFFFCFSFNFFFSIHSKLFYCLCFYIYLHHYLCH